MLYLLLYPLHKYYSGFNALRYETLRSVLAGLTALALSLALGPILIERFRELRIGQTIREVVPQAHQKKAGTPTMGGLLIVASMLSATLLLANLFNPYVWIAIFVTLTFGAIGFSDDYFKLARGKGLGLSGPAKLVWSFSCAFVAAAWLFLYLGFDTHLTVPFLKNVHPDLHWWFYIPFAMLVIVGCSHAVNLTDGLDGLAIGPVMTVALTYWVFTWVAGNVKLANYLQIPHIADVGEVAIFCASIIAASLGFLWFNAYPASMMMGDVGALALGGAIGTIAVLCKQELVLVLAGGVFVAEAASTIIQRYYFKATHKRFFLMAPLHHHFELKGIPETVVVIRFWIVSIICALVALSTLKLR
ncbi:MAG TPA: phospho-N-acetylmuramoyl-pentapeptide-transferase [Candidatus Sulfotelmatobacter sp.]|jgi:phospho-N-acetylmuramoyl-pentapeptide-transferase|nr:phospho-N-acetylmuramoyl-pentapeptide-transferase [Candidatus Sulfotelmatobacter sp.]